MKRWQATEPLSESDNAKAIAAGVRAAQQRAALQAQATAAAPPQQASPPQHTPSRAGPTAPMRSPTPLPGSTPAVSSQVHQTPSQVRVHVDADPAQAGHPTQAMTRSDAQPMPAVATGAKKLARTAPLGDRPSSAVLPFRAAAPQRKSSAWIVILLVAVLGALAIAWFVAHRLRLL